MPNPEQLSALSEACTAAFAAERITGCPAELTIGQWILESGWGSKSPGNNPFGVKQFSTSTARQLLTTKEWFTPAERDAFLARGDEREAVLDVDQNGAPYVTGARNRYTVKDWFAKFPTLRDAFIRHGVMLTSGRYITAWKQFQQGGTVDQFVSAIGPIYATAPGYSAQILGFIKSAAVQDAIRTARA